jgi:hypothetical protein
MRVAWIGHPGFFRGVDFVVTIGIFTAPATVPMLVRLIRRRRSKLRFMAGRCPACNYDMRGSKDVCPECGNPTATR